MSRYTCYALTDPDTGIYRMSKFDNDLNLNGSYTLRHVRGRTYACDCPAANRHTCRHREMMPLFLAEKAVNTGRFYDYDKKMWIAPLQTD